MADTDIISSVPNLSTLLDNMPYVKNYSSSGKIYVFSIVIQPSSWKTYSNTVAYYDVLTASQFKTYMGRNPIEARDYLFAANADFRAGYNEPVGFYISTNGPVRMFVDPKPAGPTRWAFIVYAS